MDYKKFWDSQELYSSLSDEQQEEFMSLECILVRIEHYLDEYFDDEELIEC